MHFDFVDQLNNETMKKLVFIEDCEWLIKLQ